MFFILFFFFNVTAPTEIYTLSLHDALPIFRIDAHFDLLGWSDRHGFRGNEVGSLQPNSVPHRVQRSEEHTSELQSRVDLVCRLLLEKKKQTIKHIHVYTKTLHVIISQRSTA